MTVPGRQDESSLQAPSDVRRFSELLRLTTRRRRWGLSLLAASLLLWGGVFVVPLVAGAKPDSLLLAGLLYGLSWATFAAAGMLLGK